MKLHTNHILIRLTKKTDELQLPGIGAIQIETGYEEDGHLFIYVAYEALILVKRRWAFEDYGKQLYWPNPNTVSLDGINYWVIMLNGYMLVEQDDADCETKLTLPQNMKESKAQSGTIRFIGKPNTRYHDQFNSSGKQMSGNLPDDRFDLKVGDRIGFLKFAAIDLEFDLHQSFAGKGKQFGRMQRNKVLCKL